MNPRVPSAPRPASPLSLRQRLWLRLVPLNTLRHHVWWLLVLFVRVVRESGLRVALYRASLAVRRQVSRFFRGRLTKRALRWMDPHAFEVEVAEPPPLALHKGNVDIIVCVHNALDDVRRCLELVIRYTRAPYELILVDDGSDVEARDYLAQFAFEQGCRLFRNETPVGYTLAANQGFRASTGDYVVMLNSDTMVTADWLDRLIVCVESDQHIGLAGPLSNTASWQSVPAIFDSQGDWAENPLPVGINAAEMSNQLARYSARLYPRVGFLNGFCLLIKRAVIQQLGYFDEVAFGRGFGEENDYCLRATQAGWQLAVADDAYVYHAQSRSYSHERRKQLAGHADKALMGKHGPSAISAGLSLSRDNRILEGIRARAQVMSEREQLIFEARQRWEGRRVLFVLPIGEPGGGGNVVWQEVLAMRRMGVDARIANLAVHRSFLGAAYLEAYAPVDYFEQPKDIGPALHDYDAAVATLFSSISWLESVVSPHHPFVRGYYIQDFEPDFFEPGSDSFRQAWQSYTYYPDLIRLTKTEWNRDIVRQRIGVECVVVGPSVNIDLYRPRLRRNSDWPHRPLRVAAMVRPNTARRQPEFTLRVLEQLHRQRGEKIEIVIFGCPIGDPSFETIKRQFPWRNAGMLTPDKLAALLNEVDVFADFSSFQAMGLTAMEAMACGVAVIVPQTGGARSFARPGENCLMVDTTSPEACLQALVRLVDAAAERQHLARQGLHDLVQYFPERAAYNLLAALFSD